MKKLLSVIVALGVAVLFCGSVQAAAGCCSGHKGVCEGKCCDGTPLSEKCQAKAADKAEKKADKAAKKADAAADKAGDKVNAAADKKEDAAQKKADKAGDKAKKAKKAVGE